jgi:hypothetical protein
MINPTLSSWVYPSVPLPHWLSVPQGLPSLILLLFRGWQALKLWETTPDIVPAPDQYPLIHSLPWLPSLMLLAPLCDSWTLHSLPRTVCDGPGLFWRPGSLTIHPGWFVDLAGSDKFLVCFPHIFLHISVGDNYTNLLPNSWLAGWHRSSGITQSPPCSLACSSCSFTRFHHFALTPQTSPMPKHPHMAWTPSVSSQTASKIACKQSLSLLAEMGDFRASGLFLSPFPLVCLPLQLGEDLC